MDRISAFIIAKNEEARIETALESLASFCDEIVVVDTGSSDQTKEIAAKYTPKVLDFVWVDDFSAARNFALQNCTGDWIVWIDADDEIDPANRERIQKIVLNSPQERAGFFLNYRYGENKNLLLPRIFRNGLGLEFIMPIHEYLDIPEELTSRFESHPEIQIIHRKTVSENMSSMERNIRILKKALRKNPHDNHLHFFLGREYLNSGHTKEAIETFTFMLSRKGFIPDDQSFRYNVFLHLARSFEANNELQKALKGFQEAQSADARFAEPLIYAADILLYKLREPQEALKLYRQALKIPLPETTLPVRLDFYHEYPENQILKIERLSKPLALVCGYYGQGNVGDEMMLASIIQNMRHYRIVVASYNPGQTQKMHTIEAVPHRHEQFDGALHMAQLVIIGGGTLFHDQGLSKNKTIEYYCSIIKKAADQGKRVVLLGVGVDEIVLPENRKMLVETLKKCEKIFVRDYDSQKRLIAYGSPKKSILVMPDLSFGLHFSEKKAANSRLKIGINLCPPQIDDPYGVLDIIERRLVPFIHEQSQKVDFVFIPAKEDDETLFRFLVQQCGKDRQNISLASIREGNIIADVVDAARSCDALIVSRYHMALLALHLGINTAIISYADKTEALIEEYRSFIKMDLSTDLQALFAHLSAENREYLHKEELLLEVKKVMNQL